MPAMMNDIQLEVLLGPTPCPTLSLTRKTEYLTTVP